MGFMALWLYGFMALYGRSKFIFIVSKHRVMRIFPSMKNPLTKKYFAMKIFAQQSSTNETASGNSLRSGQRQKPRGGNLVNRMLPLILQVSCLPRAVNSDLMLKSDK